MNSEVGEIEAVLQHRGARAIAYRETMLQQHLGGEAAQMAMAEGRLRSEAAALQLAMSEQLAACREQFDEVVVWDRSHAAEEHRAIMLHAGATEQQLQAVARRATEEAQSVHQELVDARLYNVSMEEAVRIARTDNEQLRAALAAAEQQQSVESQLAVSLREREATLVARVTADTERVNE